MTKLLFMLEYHIMPKISALKRTLFMTKLLFVLCSKYEKPVESKVKDQKWSGTDTIRIKPPQTQGRKYLELQKVKTQNKEDRW